MPNYDKHDKPRDKDKIDQAKAHVRETWQKAVGRKRRPVRYTYYGPRWAVLEFVEEMETTHDIQVTSLNTGMTHHIVSTPKKKQKQKLLRRKLRGGKE